tara:strand:- start:1277 stop:1867 length:591 start_codon:yes stop_codon:yes gene_type:complete
VNILEKLYKKHKTWLEITESFGVNKSTAQDIVSELYIKIDNFIKLKPNNSLMFSDNEVNYYFIYVSIRNLVFDLKRKEKKVSFEPIKDKYFAEIEDFDAVDTDDYAKHKVINDWYEDESYLEMLEDAQLLEDFSEDKMKVYYIRRIFKEVFLENTNVSKLSRNTNITYWSLRNTIKNIKKQIKNDYEFRKHIRDDF